MQRETLIKLYIQRIPIRISIDSSPHENLIKPGMSVVATVDLRS